MGASARPDAFRIMTVCTGNICRSPMAEVVLRTAFAEAGLDGVSVVSTAVTGEEVGNPIDPRAVRALGDAGYSVPRRAAVRVRREDVEGTDLVLAMTGQHARALRAVGFPAERVVLFRAFENRVPDGAAHLVAAADTPDPWYGDATDFTACLATIEACAPGVVEYVRTRLVSSQASADPAPVTAGSEDHGNMIQASVVRQE